ncbi:MAG TPA: hypothetical protein PKB10_13270, partial [Tepidisphaeraceae bacterium]|nr:hypothetical protein [Tepidisphaeraceae bacterium]
CHWPTLRGREIQAFCDQSRDFVDRVEALVLQHIRERSADTLTALCERVGPRVGRWPAGVHREMCYAISGHLEDLAARGLIRAIPGGRPRRYEPLGGNDA